jgi:excisionase family DNA binding protein
MKAEHKILTVREVAEYLRLSEAKVYRLANEGQIPGIRLGKAWRFREDLLDEWLVEQSRQELHSPGQFSGAVQSEDDRGQTSDDGQREQADGME